MKKSDIRPLLEDTCDAYYWAGLLAADGSFDAHGRLRLYLKDHDHVRRFAAFISWAGSFHPYKGSLGLSLMDRTMMPRFCHKFGLRPRKTYDPPERIPTEDGDLRFAYAVGFMDGDGCIYKGPNKSGAVLKVKCHASWGTFLGVIMESLTGQKLPLYDSGGYALYETGNTALIRPVKERVLALRLPLLARKWDKIDLSFVSRHEIAATRVAKVKSMLAAGHPKGVIAQTLGVGPSAVSNIIKRHL